MRVRSSEILVLESTSMLISFAIGVNARTSAV